MTNKREVMITETRLRESKDWLRRVSQQIGRSQAVVAAMHEAEAFTPQMLGHGRARGGNKEHRDNRYKVLERARLIRNLTVKQEGQWEYFKTSWDAAMCEAQGGKWGKVFAEFMQQIFLQMPTQMDAFSKFVENETSRALHSTGVLVAPGSA